MGGSSSQRITEPHTLWTTRQNAGGPLVVGNERAAFLSLLGPHSSQPGPMALQDLHSEWNVSVLSTKSLSPLLSRPAGLPARGWARVLPSSSYRLDRKNANTPGSEERLSASSMRAGHGLLLHTQAHRATWPLRRPRPQAPPTHRGPHGQIWCPQHRVWLQAVLGLNVSKA